MRKWKVRKREGLSLLGRSLITLNRRLQTSQLAAGLAHNGLPRRPEAIEPSQASRDRERQVRMHNRNILCLRGCHATLTTIASLALEIFHEARSDICIRNWTSGFGRSGNWRQRDRSADRGRRGLQKYLLIRSGIRSASCWFGTIAQPCRHCCLLATWQDCLRQRFGRLWSLLSWI